MKGCSSCCRELCKKLAFHAVVFLFLSFYWICEAVMFIVWLSFGVGAGYGASHLFKMITSEKLTNAWETYITLNVLACGVMSQTTCHLLFWMSVLMSIKTKAKIPYMLYKIWPLRIAIAISFYQIFAQFRLRFEKEHMDFEEENLVTLRFLLATSFLGYTVGRRIRLDNRLEEAAAGVPFVCPGVIKYCAMFAFFYGVEFVLIVVWGSPIILLAFIFRYYVFQEFITFFGLSAVGVLVAYVTAGIQRGHSYRGLFSTEDMMPLIYGEVRTNFILFTLLPATTRWYFCIQFEYPDYEESKKVNFILFSASVSLLLMYVMKQILCHKYKVEDEIMGRLRRIPEEDLLQHVPINNIQQRPINSNDIENANNDSSTISTGIFSGSSSASSNSSSEEGSNNTGGQNHYYYFSRAGSNAPYSMEEFTSSFSPEHLQRARANQLRFGNYTSQSKTQAIQTQLSKSSSKAEMSADSSQIDIETENNEGTNTDVESPNLRLNLSPLKTSIGIMTIDKRWRDQMLNPGHIKRLSYGRNFNRIPIPVLPPAIMTARSIGQHQQVRQVGKVPIPKNTTTPLIYRSNPLFVKSENMTSSSRYTDGAYSTSSIRIVLDRNSNPQNINNDEEDNDDDLEEFNKRPKK